VLLKNRQAMDNASRLKYTDLTILLSIRFLLYGSLLWEFLSLSFSRFAFLRGDPEILRHG
jgi:hypothetical protein